MSGGNGFAAAATGPTAKGLISGVAAARLILASTGALAMVWAIAVIPVFRSERAIIDVARAVIAGEKFEPEVLSTVLARSETDGDSTLRSSVQGKVAVIRLRQAEDAIRAGHPDAIKQKLKSLTSSVRESLSNAPDDPFLWLAWFWLANTRTGVRPDNLPFLQMSYDLGPHEGWIAIKRDRVALAEYSTLTRGLAERAISEFVDLVRWGLYPEAADIAAATAPSLRVVLFVRLKELSLEQRRVFASVMYGRGLDDVPVPGIAPPGNPFPLPVLPPDFYH
jgi:hypothetical protein